MAICFLWLKAITVLILYNGLMTFCLYGVKIIGSMSMLWIMMIVIDLTSNVLTTKGGQA